MTLHTGSASAGVKRVALALTAAVVCAITAACGSSEDSAHKSVHSKKSYADERQAGGSESSNDNKLAELESEKAKTQKNLDELTRKIDNIQQNWDTIRHADPQYKASTKERREMMNLRAEQEKQEWKLGQINKQIKELKAQ